MMPRRLVTNLLWLLLAAAWLFPLGWTILSRFKTSNVAIFKRPFAPPGVIAISTGFLTTRARVASALPPHPVPLPEERGIRKPALLFAGASRTFETLPTILPLPKGEGWGEGEGNARQPTGTESTLRPSLA
jgi:ABC-type glycerol-3-phosphate transport system permease component